MCPRTNRWLTQREAVELGVINRDAYELKKGEREFDFYNEILSLFKK